VAGYDSILDKHPLLLETELLQTLDASAITIARARGWLEGEIHPHGPIAGEADLNLVYKTAWAFVQLVDTDTAIRLLDWVAERAVQDSGDIYIPDVESPAGVYRQSWILRAAARVGHPLATDQRVIDRMLSFQDQSTGAASASPGPDSAAFTSWATAAFGEWALDAGFLEEARRAGECLVALLADQPEILREKRFRYAIGDSASRDEWVGGSGRDDPTWIISITTAFLTDLWRATEGDAATASRYRDAALTLFALDAELPLETYFSFNRCKLAWSAGLLATTLCERGEHDLALLDRLYRCLRRVYRHTFLGTRLEDGSWPHEFYVADDADPLGSVDYQTLAGLSSVPQPAEWTAQGTQAAFASAHEITAENLYCLTYLRRGVDHIAGVLLKNHHPDLETGPHTSRGLNGVGEAPTVASRSPAPANRGGIT
jgi:hypothetical protein